jgi:hypothetical protein
VLWARKDFGDVELSRRRMEKIGREPRRERGPSIRVILAQRNFWPKDCVLGVAGSERKGVRIRGNGGSELVTRSGTWPAILAARYIAASGAGRG